ncbi:MAG: alpha/beta fold hydrolase [Gemmatimonadetes bacterium]|nr:alpha/beta fold hydrolase [Gemmatimonadota bacterium]
MRKNGPLLALSLGLVTVGGALSLLVQTNFGRVHIEDVRFPGPDGIIQNARLFVPDGITEENPAPGIVAIHGYINTHETQAGFAIEFARRGYVVLAVDQTGHGYSDPPSGANGFGGPPALEFLRTLGVVDPENVGLEGHSMGGWAVQAAAAAQPNGYRSIVLQGASVSARGDTSNGSAPLRNTSVVFSRFDEFSRSMWGVPIPTDIVGTERLKGFFGTEEDVVPGRIYGSIENGDARILHQPAVTHPGDHLSRAAIGHAVDWFQQTLDGGNDLPPSHQIWYWKEIGTLLALVGLVFLLLAVGGMLLETPWFEDLKGDPGRPKPAEGVGWWVAAAAFALLPVLTLFPFKDLASRIGLSSSTLFPQSITNQVVTWTTLVGLLSLVLFVFWHVTTNRKRGATVASYGLTPDNGVEWGRIGKSFLLALIIVSVGHLVAQVSAILFKSDFRFWVFAVRPLDSLHARIALSYAVPFIGFFLILSAILHGQLRRSGLTVPRETAVNLGLLVSGFVGLLVVQYLPLFLGGTMTVPSEPLWTIISFQFLPIMTIVALITTFFFRRTGMVYVGGFVCGLLVTWIVVASQATHVAM